MRGDDKINVSAENMREGWMWEKMGNWRHVFTQDAVGSNKICTTFFDFVVFKIWIIVKKWPSFHRSKAVSVYVELPVSDEEAQE